MKNIMIKMEKNDGRTVKNEEKRRKEQTTFNDENEEENDTSTMKKFGLVKEIESWPTFCKFQFSICLRFLDS